MPTSQYSTHIKLLLSTAVAHTFQIATHFIKQLRMEDQVKLACQATMYLYFLLIIHHKLAVDSPLTKVTIKWYKRLHIHTSSTCTKKGFRSANFLADNTTLQINRKMLQKQKCVR